MPFISQKQWIGGLNQQSVLTTVGEMQVIMGGSAGGFTTLQVERSDGCHAHSRSRLSSSVCVSIQRCLRRESTCAAWRICMVRESIQGWRRTKEWEERNQTTTTGLTENTHLLEAHYNHSLIGPFSTHAQLYTERSPVTHAHNITVPLLILQVCMRVVEATEQWAEQ